MGLATAKNLRPDFRTLLHFLTQPAFSAFLILREIRRTEHEAPSTTAHRPTDRLEFPGLPNEAGNVTHSLAMLDEMRIFTEGGIHPIHGNPADRRTERHLQKLFAATTPQRIALRDAFYLVLEQIFERRFAIQEQRVDMDRPIRPRIRGPFFGVQFQELRAIGAADFRMQLRGQIPEQNVIMRTPGFFTVLRSTEEADTREASPASFLPQMLEEGFNDTPRNGAIRRKELIRIGESDRYD